MCHFERSREVFTTKYLILRQAQDDIHSFTKFERMEFKKNPKLELKKNSTLYFMIGLTFILLLAFVAIEWKTYYHTKDWDLANLDVQDELIEEVPLIIEKLPPPPPPKIQSPPVIEIVEDDKEIIETLIESNEPDQDTEVMDVEDVDFVENPSR